MLNEIKYRRQRCTIVPVRSIHKSSEGEIGSLKTVLCIRNILVSVSLALCARNKAQAHRPGAGI